jgi:hypothetical protein
MTRFRAFFAVRILGRLAEREGFSAIMKNMNAIEGEAWMDMAKAGPSPPGYVAVRVVMALVLILVPFVVRLDYKAPIKGVLFLPLSILLSYVYASVLNIIIAAGLCWGISLQTGQAVSPNALTLLMHPLYLLAPPLLDSVAGTVSQYIYILFTYSVLSAPNKIVERAETPVSEELATAEADGEWNKSACIMEMDRLTRLIDAKIQSPALIDAVRMDVSDYINNSPAIHIDLKSGEPHYKIILVRTAASLRKLILENPQNSDAGEAILFVVDEMEKMEYMTSAEREELRELTSKIPTGISSDRLSSPGKNDSSTHATPQEG